MFSLLNPNKLNKNNGKYKTIKKDILILKLNGKIFEIWKIKNAHNIFIKIVE